MKNIKPQHFTNVFCSLLLSLSLFSMPVNAQKTSTRIIGGNEANLNDLPAIVSLKYNGHFFCAGTLIGAEWIVTAAHCHYETIRNIANITVTISDYNLTEEQESTPVLDVRIHPDYNKETINNDIALIKLATPSLIPPLVISKVNHHDITKNATIWGWGVTTTSSPYSLPNFLQKATISILPDNQCLTLIGSNYDSATMLCAGNTLGTIDTCFGDSGGPIIVNNELVGITSWGGDNCADKDHPGVYVRVENFQPWITSIITNTPIEDSSSSGSALGFGVLLLPLIFIRRAYSLKEKHN